MATGTLYMCACDLTRFIGNRMDADIACNHVT